LESSVKTYPKISPEITNQPIYAFDKLDGSNIRAEWSRKAGFYKFGSRKRLVGDDDPLLGESRQLVQNKYAQDLEAIFRSQRWDKVVCFFEFLGERSFAGLHENEPHDVVLFDVSVHRKGILEPRDFLKIFGDLHTPPLLYHGNPNVPFLDSVRAGELDGMTFEGVVCKGKSVSPGRPLMFKVKNRAWVDKVKALYGHDEKKLNEVL